MIKKRACLFLLNIFFFGLFISQILSLNSQYFNLSLDSDYLASHARYRDFAEFGYPIKGWAVSGAPSFFPDLVLVMASVSLVGFEGAAYPVYTVLTGLFWVLLGYLGCRLFNKKESALSLLLPVLILLNAFLELRIIHGHNKLLWWLLVPEFHGGMLLVVLGYWLSFVMLMEKWTLLRAAIFVGIGALGLISDGLFLFNGFAPVAILLAFLWLRDRKDRLVYKFFVLLGFSAALWIGSKIVFSQQEWFYFRKVMFRHYPTPSNVFNLVSNFVNDLWQGGMWQHLWGFGIITGVFGYIIYRLRGSERSLFSLETYQSKVIFLFVVSLLIILPMPFFFGYWKNPQNIRYFISWMFLPAIAIIWFYPVKIHEKKFLSIFVSLVVAVLGIYFSFIQKEWRIVPEKLTFQYPQKVEALDQWLVSENRKWGLAEFWDSIYLYELSREGIRVNHIRKDRFPYFWDTNIYRFLNIEDGFFSWPEYSFIVMNGLDKEHWIQVFGPPSKIEQIGGYEIYCYDGDARKKLNAVLKHAVLNKYSPKQTQFLEANWNRYESFPKM